jgi:hypothetical protein
LQAVQQFKGSYRGVAVGQNVDVSAFTSVDKLMEVSS